MTWNIVRASVAGTSHAFNNIECQDNCFAEVYKTASNKQYLILAASDGAGSATFSAKGAEIACAAFATKVYSRLEEAGIAILDSTLITSIVEDVRSAIVSYAALQQEAPRAFACTLLTAVISDSTAVFAQIGDGFICACGRSANGIVFWPESSEYANMTRFLTDEDALQRLQVCETECHFDELALLTDGLQRLAITFESQTPHMPFFEPMFAKLRTSVDRSDCDLFDERLRVFLNSDSINMRTDDDKTLILATRKAP